MKHIHKITLLSALTLGLTLPVGALAQMPMDQKNMPMDHGKMGMAKDKMGMAQDKMDMAQDKMDMAQDKMGMAQDKMGAGMSMTAGEVKKIDQEAGKITLKHGPIEHMEMPGMTMAFTVKDKNQLSNLKPGDKVQFTVVNENGKMVITSIAPTE